MTVPSPPPLDGELAWCHPSFDRMTDLVLAIDEATIIRYANPAGEALLGWATDEVVGRSVAEFLHPDDLGRAAEVVGLMQGDGLGVAVTPATYRVRHRDGHYLPLELNAAEPVADGPDRGTVVIVARYSGDTQLQDRVLELLSANAPVDEIVALVPGFGSWRHPDDHYAVRYRALDGTPVAVGSAAVTALMETFDGPTTPWAVAERGVEVTVGADDLDPALRAAAEAAGLRVCWVLPVTDPVHDAHAVLVAWTRTGARPLVHRYALEMMRRSLRLVLQWRQHVADLERAARTDSLTGVANRAALFAELDRVSGARRSRRDDASLVGVLAVDLDRFKAVNDRYGHAAGDRVLEQVSTRLAGAVRRGDTVGRLGGDEFAVVLPGLADPAEAVLVAQRVVAELSEPIETTHGTVTVGASVGVVVAQPGAEPVDRLLEAADRALYEVKAAGGGGWRLVERA